LSDYGPFWKNPHFSVENEWRLVKRLDSRYSSDVQFRTASTARIPYLCLPLTLSDGLSPISSVTIGPTQDFTSEESSLVRLLKKHGLAGTSIHVSDIPLRRS
jgi:hypothetical protein